VSGEAERAAAGGERGAASGERGPTAGDGERGATAGAGERGAASGERTLTVRGLRVAHGPVEVVHRIDLDVRRGGVTALLGANGAGKTTTLRAILGHLRPTAGSVRLGEREIARARAHKIARAGVALVPEGRRVFASLTVRDNLRMGGYGVRGGVARSAGGVGSADAGGIAGEVRRAGAGAVALGVGGPAGSDGHRIAGEAGGDGSGAVALGSGGGARGLAGLRAWRSPGSIAYPLELFPELEALLDRPAGLLSGGQQQMLAMGRALMRRPTLLVLDEPSMGLAPKVVQRIYDALAQLRDDGTTILLAEQNARAALALADDAVLLRTGAVVAAGSAAELRDGELVREIYLGAA
jgi:ABC-type branched-subunit amino acid transport system ATPase component